MTRRWYWKLYLLLMALLTILGLGFTFFLSEENSSIEDMAGWVALPMYLVHLVGLFGFVYGRRIGSARVWKLAFAVTVLDFLWMGYSLAIDTAPLANTNAMFLVFMATAVSAIFVPLLAALYVYAFRSHAMWDREDQRQPA